MAIKIKHGQAIPEPSNLDQYQLGFSEDTQKLYTKNGSNKIINLSGPGIFTGIIPSTTPTVNYDLRTPWIFNDSDIYEVDIYELSETINGGGVNNPNDEPEYTVLSKIIPTNIIIGHSSYISDSGNTCIEIRFPQKINLYNFKILKAVVKKVT